MKVSIISDAIVKLLSLPVADLFQEQRYRVFWA
jgi:hypothetical protein